MPVVPWLEQAARLDIDPRRRIMRPSGIRYDLLDPEVAGLVRPLNETCGVETLCSCGGHPSDVPSDRRSARAALVLVHVLDASLWRSCALAIAGAIRDVPLVTASVSFDHEAQLWLDVPPQLAPDERRYLLDQALTAATRAVIAWSGAYSQAAD